MAKRSGGLSVKTFGGLNKKNYKKGTGFGDRLKFQSGEPFPVQFVADISDDKQWKEIWQHQFNDNGWKYVPCVGDDCPLCEDDDPAVSKKSYRFITNVWSFKDKKLVVMEGPKDLSGRIAYRYENAEKKKSGSFLRKVWDVTRMETTPVSYDVEFNEDRKVTTIDLTKCVDLDKYIQDSAARYFGEDSPVGKKAGKSSKSALDDDDEDDDDAQEDEYDEDELSEMTFKEVRSIAKNLGIKVLDKEGEKRTQRTLIKLILKKQS